MASNIDLFFNTSRNKRTFPEVLAEIQEYLASKYSTLITDNPEEQHQQITAYIAKYLNDYSLGVEGMSHEELIDKLYTEMAEFSFLTPYLFANDVEEININSWKDVKITYADGRVVPTKDRFQTPQHAVDLGYVCVDVIGNLIKPNYVSSTFGKLLAKNNLRHIRFHDLRHTCASLLLANGVPMEQVKEWLGHSEISTTVDIYGHLQYATKKQSAAAIEQDIVAPMLQNLSAVSP